MPRTNRGLVILLRRETPMAGTGISNKPARAETPLSRFNIGRTERIEYTEDENEDQWGKILAT